MRDIVDNVLMPVAFEAVESTVEVLRMPVRTSQAEQDAITYANTGVWPYPVTFTDGAA